MDLIPSQTQELLVDSARAFTARECPPPRVRAAASSPDGFDPGLWATMGELGWCGLTIPEHHGGSGQGLLELAMLCEALGHGPVPSPLVASSVLAALPIALAGTDAQRERWLPALAAGTAIGTLATVEPGDPHRDGVGATGERRLRGTRLLVPWAPNADVVVVGTPGGLRLVEPRHGGVTFTRHDDLRVEPLYAAHFDDATAEPLGDGGPAEHAEVLGRVVDHAAVVHLAAAVGAGEAALDLTLDHARTRHQFGRPIGSFQAVAHRCVDMRADLDACRLLAYRAAWSLDRGVPADLEVGGALAYGSVALRTVLGHAHQVHGAFGFSTESDLFLYTRAAKAFELAYGSATTSLERVAVGMGLD